MINKRNKHKKIVYWGIGGIGKYCLEIHPKIEPIFFIDSYTAYKIFEKKSVKHPSEIDDWSQYYIVITIKSSKAKLEIQKFLEEKGLLYEQDFCTYENFFPWPAVTFEKSISLIKKYKKEHPEAINPILLKIPLVGIRNGNIYRNFFLNYAKKRGDEKCIFLSEAQEEDAGFFLEEIKHSVIPIYNKISNNKNNTEENKRIKNLLTKKEFNWLENLIDRKKNENKEEEIYNSALLYNYYKTVIRIINPSKIIYWGNWSIESYIVGYLSNMYNIPCGYMEYGLVPGTYQIDPRGIAGQSEYAVKPEIFDELEVDEIYDIEQVKQYIKDQKLDTGTFTETEDDTTALLRIDENRKTVFLVGMDDHGMRMNPKNKYWKKYISNVVESTEEALLLLVKLCRKNNWNLVFKPHPGSCTYDLKNDSENVIYVCDMEIDRLIKLADVVVSIVSAVDYKTLIYGKPLVQLGITGLRGKGCTYIVSKKEMLEEQIRLALNNGMTKKQTENFDRLIQILLQKYLWDDMSERGIRYGLTVDHDFL